ncbi:MAG TPA: class II glutamine amidotransferase [Burkholderiales bacterium]|jgi:predicted glutamine amidotransferase|nr:class II glutamine amidotransferase [Burkholderiales bacterium]
MCRVLAYLGRPVVVEELLYRSDSSLVRQIYDPKMLHLLSLAGFGMAAWDLDSYSREVPFEYHTPDIPVFDDNLRSLARKLHATCLLAHVRGVSYSASSTAIGHHNSHPFRYDGFRLALAHNGDLARFADMKFDLLAHMKPGIASRIRGTTDSEWMYALIMSQLRDPAAELAADEIMDAVRRALVILRDVREKHDIHASSSVNLFLCDGSNLVATRFTFDFGCYPETVNQANFAYLSLWYTFGRDYGLHDGEWKMRGGLDDQDSVIIASEPLTRDSSTWIEAPEYSMIYVAQKGGRWRVETTPLDV